MTIAQGATTFGTLHGAMNEGPWNMPIQTLSVPGAIGVSHLIDETKERQLSCPFRIHGYASYALCKAALDAVDAVNGKLTGTVTITGTLASTYTNCTFIGFDRGQIKYDGSGQNGWWVEGRLVWIQRSRS